MRVRRMMLIIAVTAGVLCALASLAAEPAAGGEKPPLFSLAEIRASEKPAGPEFQEFARKLVDALNRGDSAFVVDSLNRKGLAQRVLRRLGVEQENSLPSSGSSGQAKSSIALRGRVLKPKEREKIERAVDNYIMSVAKGLMETSPGVMKLRRCIVDLEATKMVVRSIGKAGAYWYEFWLVKKPDGSVQIDELFTASDSDKYSAELARILEPFVALIQIGNVKKMASAVGPAGEFCELQVLSLANLGKYREAYEAYLALPEQKRKVFATQRQALFVTNKMGTDTPGNQTVMDDIAKHNRDNPGAQILLLDYYWAKNDFSAVRACLKEIRSRFGSDAYIDFLDGAVSVEEGDYKSALATAKRGLNAEPELTDLYSLAATCHLQLRDYPALKQVLLDRMRVDPEFKPEFSEDQETHKEFLASPAYQEFLKESAVLREKTAAAAGQAK